MYFSRPLIPCICAYSVGLWLVHDIYHHTPYIAFSIAAVLLLLSGLLAWRYKTQTPLFLLLLTVLGGVVMFSRESDASLARQQVAALHAPGILRITGSVRTLSDISDTERTRLTLSRVKITSGTTVHTLPGLVNVNTRADVFTSSTLPLTGDHVRIYGRIGPPAALRNFFGYNRLEALRHEQVYAVVMPLDATGAIVIEQADSNWKGRATQALTIFRHSVSSQIRSVMWPREGRLMVAMLFNDMKGLTDDERRIFRDSQTFHLFAVSGMHVAILGLVLHIVLRAMRVGLRFSWVTVAVILFIYLWIIGFVPSATRSYLMLVAFTSGYILKREVDSITSLAFAVATVLAFDPACWWKAGFTLSVAGVASIVMLVPLLNLWFGLKDDQWGVGFASEVRRGGASAVIVTLAVSIGMLPMQLYYFGFWNLTAPIANLLQASLSSLVLSGGCFTALLGHISPALAEIAGQATSLLMWVIYQVSRWAAHSPWAMLTVPHVPPPVFFSCYVILFSGYYLVWKDTPEFRQKSRARFAVHLTGCFGLLFIFSAQADLKPRHLEIWTFDVGQGDSTLIRTPAGHTFLVDGGVADPDMGSLVILPQLRALGIERLDYVIATHDDVDHIGGLATVLDQPDVGFLCVPPPTASSRPSREMTRLLQAAKANFVTVRELTAGFHARSGDCRLSVLNPVLNDAADRSDNDSSIIMILQHGNFSALFTGDAGLAIESRLINNGSITSATILKVGHHGSRFSTGEELVQALQPRVALISCGYKNQFRHPHPEVLARLQQADTRIFRTDTMGSTCVVHDDSHVSIRSAGTPGSHSIKIH